MMKETTLAKELLNAVYEEDIEGVDIAIDKGANPSWIFNGFPILLHAVYLQNYDMVMMLIRKGATQKEEALGFALEQGIGELVWPLAYLGIVPKAAKTKDDFGLVPSRFAPTSIAYQH